MRFPPPLRNIGDLLSGRGIDVRYEAVRWRAVDHGGEVPESYVTGTRGENAAIIFVGKALKRRRSPEAVTTDGLRSYGAAWT